MRFWLPLGIVLCLLAGAAGCQADHSDASAKPLNPRQFAMIMDMPCSQVQARVREVLKTDPELGLAQEREAPLGRAFVMPTRTNQQRRWTATVLVQCADPQTARLEVVVKAERKVGDRWESAGEAPSLEKHILDKVTPRP